jgi:hypothetical protein
MPDPFLYSAPLGFVKRLTAILVPLLAFSGVALAADPDPVPFAVGEKLTYQIFWGPFVVGRATLEVAGTEPVDGHDCYHLIAKAKTSGLIDLLFPVNSLAESWLDRDGLFSRKYSEDRTEGAHHRATDTHYDYVNKQAVMTNHINGRVKRMALDQHVEDVVSSVYVVRTRKLMLDSEQTFRINDGSTNYNVTIRPDERKSLWVRPVGDIPALRIEPTPTLNIVSANKGRMWFWISDDPRRLPLLVNTELKFGNAKLVLYSVTPAKTSASTANFLPLTPNPSRLDSTAPSLTPER